MEDNKIQAKIKIIKDGPYIVSGKVPMREQKIVQHRRVYRYEDVKDFPEQENYSLCRCGHSGNAPYCDGSHYEAEFKGTETAKKDKTIERAERIEGPGIILTDTEDLCAFARFCHGAEGDIWDLVEKTDDPEIRKVVIREANECPAGRLVVWDKETGEAIENKLDEAVVILQDPGRKVSGPIWVQGGIPVEGAGGEAYEIRNRVTLCRCGESKNKPFCDTSHICTQYLDKKE
jgi:CDGSH-type Zn-finger protein